MVALQDWPAHPVISWSGGRSKPREAHRGRQCGEVMGGGLGAAPLLIRVLATACLATARGTRNAESRNRCRPPQRPATLENDRKLVRSEMRAMEEAGSDRRRGGPDRRGPAEKTKILIVDDHALFRVGIRSVLEREPDLEIVGEADDPRSALVAALETSPDIILMDLSLPAPGGIEATRRIKRELPSAGIILLASDEDEDALFDAIKAGAAAFILKDLVPDRKSVV